MHEDRPITQRDPRFGGNMERANVGAQYAGASRDFYGGPSRGSPMLDQRYENYQAPHRVDYTSPQGGTYPHELQHQGVPRQHPNPRMRHINPRGMNKTVDPLYNLMAQQAGAFGGSQSYGGMGRPPQEMPRRLGPPSNIGYDRMGGGLGGPPSNIGYDRMGEELGGIGGLQEQSAVDPSDWRTILKILEAGGDPGTETQTAYNPGDYDRPMGMGPGGWDSIGNRYGENYEDLETIPLDMQFDQWGNPIGGDDYGYFGDTFAARGGLMSLRR